MKITKLQFITGLLITLACSFLIGVLFNLHTLSNYSRALVFPLFVYLYLVESDRKSTNFAVFLIACAVAEFSRIFWQFDYNLVSKITNIAYVFGYANLLIYIARSINLGILIKKFKLPIIVLTVFNVYLILALNQMILADDTLEVYTLNFLIECTYNVCILLVLSFSLINYLYHDTKRGLMLFLVSVCIVFSEMVQVANLFVNSGYILNVVYSMLLIAGFYLVYIYIMTKMNTYYKMLF
ncbi:hypothetical protein [Lacinutrix chionoecetis]